jgi:serine/threonine protein kinase
MADRVGQQFGSYRLVTLLGQGGFAEVYLGQHVRLKLQAAIKVFHIHLTGQEAAHFQQEVETIATLVHPSIVRILDYDVQEGVPFLVMDYVPNGSLRQCYPRCTVVPLPQIVSPVKQVAAALQYAHNQKFIHRNVKPENMFLVRPDEVLLSDFELAAVAHCSASLSMQEALSTLPYMAPEQIEGYPCAASDQYALGMVTYEWLCGSRPFEGSVTEMVVQQFRLSPPPLRERVSTIIAEMEQVVLRALAREPKDRFDSVQDFAVALEQAISLHPGHPRLLVLEKPLPGWAAETGYATVAIAPGQPVLPGEASPMVPTLDIRLLGDFRLRYGDQQVTSLNTMRLQSLLAYLVLHRDAPQQRQHLAFLFWLDTTEAQARNNLRQLLHQLRQVFPAVEHFLSTDKHTLYWHPVTPINLDVAAFERALAEATAAAQLNDQHALQAALEQADSLYCGELLPGCYDEWIFPERERFRQRHLQALERLLRLFEGRGDTVTAIRFTRRLLGLDPSPKIFIAV